MTEAHLLHALFGLSALCIVYKLAYLVRQSAALPGPVVRPFRVLAVTLGTLITFQVATSVDAQETPSISDILINISWCAVLAAIIVMVGRGRHVW